MKARFELHKILCSVLDCPESGTECRVYFEPPENLRLQYPCLVYGISRVNARYADNRLYIACRGYDAVLITKNPDDPVWEKMLDLPMCRLDRRYMADNLHHFAYELYY